MGEKKAAARMDVTALLSVAPSGTPVETPTSRTAEARGTDSGYQRRLAEAVDRPATNRPATSAAKPSPEPADDVSPDRSAAPLTDAPPTGRAVTVAPAPQVAAEPDAAEPDAAEPDAAEPDAADGDESPLAFDLAVAPPVTLVPPALAAAWNVQLPADNPPISSGTTAIAAEALPPAVPPGLALSIPKGVESPTSVTPPVEPGLPALPVQAIAATPTVVEAATPEVAQAEALPEIPTTIEVDASAPAVAPTPASTAAAPAPSTSEPANPDSRPAPAGDKFQPPHGITAAPPVANGATPVPWSEAIAVPDSTATAEVTPVPPDTNEPDATVGSSDVARHSPTPDSETVNFEAPRSGRVLTATDSTPPTTQTAETRPSQHEFAARIADAIRHAEHGPRELRLRLHPPELGALQVEVASRGGAVTARLEVETVAARQAILDTIPLLHDSLTQHGATVERIEVHLADAPRDDRGFGQRSDQQQEHGRQGHPEDQRRRETTPDEPSTTTPPVIPRQRTVEQLDIAV